MKPRTWIAAVMGFAALTAACSGPPASSTAQDQSPVAVGDTASAFTLESAKGNPVSLSDYAGKPVLLYFSMGPG